jgi:hypothetical protein
MHTFLVPNPTPQPPLAKNPPPSPAPHRPLGCRRGCGCAAVFPHTSCSIHKGCALCDSYPPRHPRADSDRCLCLRQRYHVPVKLLSGTLFRQLRRAEGNCSPLARHRYEPITPVTPFVCAIAPGTTRNAHPPPGLPCPGDGQLALILLGALSSECGLSNTG